MERKINNHHTTEYRKAAIRIIAGLLLLFVISLTAVSCKKENQTSNEEGAVTVYYINREETKNVGVHYVPSETEALDRITELLEELKKQPEAGNLRATIPDNMRINNVVFFEEQVTIDFDPTYKKMSPTTELLFRAAVVRTLTQLDEVKFVQFLVDGEPLLNSSEELVGLMSGDMFFDNADSEISTNENANLILYFANEDGTKLIPVERSVEYNSNVPIEKVVVEQILAGPVGNDSYPTIADDVKILNVSVTDGVCYVNLDSGFLVQAYNVNSDVVVYSLVNSLTNLKHVNKVQILVDGKSDIFYRESIDLSLPLIRNLDLISQ